MSIDPSHFYFHSYSVIVHFYDDSHVQNFGLAHAFCTKGKWAPCLRNFDGEILGTCNQVSWHVCICIQCALVITCGTIPTEELSITTHFSPYGNYLSGVVQLHKYVNELYQLYECRWTSTWPPKNDQHENPILGIFYHLCLKSASMSC